MGRHVAEVTKKKRLAPAVAALGIGSLGFGIPMASASPEQTTVVQQDVTQQVQDTSDFELATVKNPSDVKAKKNKNKLEIPMVSVTAKPSKTKYSPGKATLSVVDDFGNTASDSTKSVGSSGVGKYIGAGTTVTYSGSGMGISSQSWSSKGTPWDSASVPFSNHSWVNPVPGSHKTSLFGHRGDIGLGTMAFHNGVDLAKGLGSPIYAANDGVVVHVGSNDFDTHTGGIVVIAHKTPEGVFLSSYNHMSMSGILVTVGQKVTAGTQIAKVGSEGKSSGPHCHFSIRKVTGEVNILNNWQIVEPVGFMKSHGVSL